MMALNTFAAQEPESRATLAEEEYFVVTGKDDYGIPEKSNLIPFSGRLGLSTY